MFEERPYSKEGAVTASRWGWGAFIWEGLVFKRTFGVPRGLGRGAGRVRTRCVL